MAGDVITTGNHPKGLWPGIKLHWGHEYGRHDEQHRDLFDVETSDKAYEELIELTGFPVAPIKPEGEPTTFATESQQTVTRLTHVAYSLGYKVTKEELDDNKYVAVSQNRSTANAFSMFTTKQTVAANVYNRAFTSAYSGGDGKELCATDHPTLAGNQSNELSTAADLSEASLEDLLVQIMNVQNSRGHKIPIMPRCLIVPTNLYFEANRIVNSTLRVDTANNDVNVINMVGALPEGIKVNNYLTDTDAWFVRTNAPGGMKMYQRTPIEFTRDNDFTTDNALAKAYERYVVGWGDWRAVFGSPGA